MPVMLQFAEASVSPPVAAALGALLAVSLGDGVVGLFESRMPFKEPDLLPLHAMSRPLAILAMLLVGGWQFVRTKWVCLCHYSTAHSQLPSGVDYAACMA